MLMDVTQWSPAVVLHVLGISPILTHLTGDHCVNPSFFLTVVNLTQIPVYLDTYLSSSIV